MWKSQINKNRFNAQAQPNKRRIGARFIGVIKGVLLGKGALKRFVLSATGPDVDAHIKEISPILGTDDRLVMVEKTNSVLTEMRAAVKRLKSTGRFPAGIEVVGGDFFSKAALALTNETADVWVFDADFCRTVSKMDEEECLSGQLHDLAIHAGKKTGEIFFILTWSCRPVSKTERFVEQWVSDIWEKANGNTMALIDSDTYGDGTPMRTCLLRQIRKEMSPTLGEYVEVQPTRPVVVSRRVVVNPNQVKDLVDVQEICRRTGLTQPRISQRAKAVKVSPTCVFRAPGHKGNGKNMYTKEQANKIIGRVLF